MSVIAITSRRKEVMETIFVAEELTGGELQRGEQPDCLRVRSLTAMNMEHRIYASKWIRGVSARQRIIHPLIVGDESIFVIAGCE